MHVTLHQDADVGYVTLNHPPVNAIGQVMRQGLLEAVRWAEKNRFTRVIVQGAGRAFAAGADAGEFDAMPLEPHLPDVLNAIDESFVPWIAAIDGVALGGGAEIAMACRMRIMGPNAQIGLPEVTLGVLPGAGGTARLPRLVGLGPALDMITGGKAIRAAKAFEWGLTDLVEEDPVEAAFLVNTEELGCIVPTWERHAPAAAPDIIDQTRARLAKKSAGHVAPLRALDVVVQGLDVPFHDALIHERAVFLDLKTSAESKALRHIFFAERGAKIPDALKDIQVALSHVAVVGGGTMGAGICYALLAAGLSVTLLETDADGVARAQSNVDQIFSASLKRGLIDAKTETELRGRLTLSHDYADAVEATLAIEAAVESMDVKASVFEKLSAALPKDAILATNTSYLDVDQIAATLKDPSRLVGLHFFAPAHIMKLLEIVQGDKTSANAMATGFALAKVLRKIPVLSGVCDGFIGNRILARYREAADSVFIDGSSPFEIDNAMQSFGYAMGPYAAQDLSGLDIAHANRRRQDATRDPNRRYVPIADHMVGLGKLGRKTGAGWYQYPNGGDRVADPSVVDVAIDMAQSAGITRTQYAPEQITEILLLAMINEAADILHEGIAQSAQDIDLVTVFGYGFPRWRGGLMHYADSIGVPEILEKLEKRCSVDPVVWRISPVIKDCANSGRSLAEFVRAS